MNIREIEKLWNSKAENLLKGKKIVDVRYMTEKERDMLGWNSRCIIIVLDDGTAFYPSKDDEGNDAGALFVDNMEKDISEILPVI